jgi:hypothetical protein
MADLNFLGSLNDKQAAYAEEIVKEAKRLGVPPVLALGIVMNESKFNPESPDGADGEIGGFQVKPINASAFKYTAEQLRDPKINMEVGLKLLKQNLDRTKGDWMLSAALYNAGDKSLLNATVEKNGIPEQTKTYLQNLKSYGVFNTGATEGASGEAQPASEEEPAGETESMPDYSKLINKMEQRQKETAGDSKIIQDATERTEAQLVGAGTGAAITAKRMAPAAIKASARLLEEGRIAAQADAEALRLATARGTAGTVGSTGAAGSAAGSTGGSGPLSTAVEGNGRRPPGRGAGLFNYGIEAGLTDIEAARALDMTKQEGGANDLLTQRREAMNRINRVAPNQFVENPRFGGLLTPTGGGGGGARESFRMIPEVPPSPEVPGGQPAAMRPMPVAPPISTAPPKPGGLEYVRDLFTGLMDSKVGRGVGTFMRYAGPPAALFGAAGETMNINQEMNKPSEERNYDDMALSGLGAVTGLASLAASPYVAIPAGLTATGIGAYRYLRDRAAADEANQRMTGNPAKPVQARGFRAP